MRRKGEGEEVRRSGGQGGRGDRGGQEQEEEQEEEVRGQDRSKGEIIRGREFKGE